MCKEKKQKKKTHSFIPVLYSKLKQYKEHYKFSFCSGVKGAVSKYGLTCVTQCSPYSLHAFCIGAQCLKLGVHHYNLLFENMHKRESGTTDIMSKNFPHFKNHDKWRTQSSPLQNQICQCMSGFANYRTIITSLHWNFASKNGQK